MTIAPQASVDKRRQTAFLPDGSRVNLDAILADCKKTAKQAHDARSEFEPQWKINEAFASGNHWLRTGDGDQGRRVLTDIRQKLYDDGRSVQEADVLTQYLWTALGKMANDDFRPALLAQHDDESSTIYAEALNDTFGWGWDQEWKGDARCLDILHTIAVYGTCPVRCRYDRTRGPFLGEVPYADQKGYTYQQPQDGAKPMTFGAGRPILDPAARRAYVADKAQYGEPVDLRPLREGQIVWEVGTPWNILPPPGVENPEDFPYDQLVRAAHVDLLKTAFPDKADLIEAQAIETSGLLPTPQTGAKAKLQDHALVYTRYLRPTVNHPRGQTVVWTGDVVLSYEERLPYNQAPWGPRSGVTYFKYWPVKRRFFGRALIEPGIGPQRLRNKRLSQADEIIDRGLPKTYGGEGDLDPTELSGAPLEWVNLKPGSAKPVIDPGIGPGPWMKASIEQCDIDIQQGLGLHDASIGQALAPGTPYASMALQVENDQQKLGPITASFQANVCDLVRDSVESMNEWPDGKTMALVGEENGEQKLRMITFKRSILPSGYLVAPARRGGLPRSQGAELQKITDIWQASLACGVAVHDPEPWIDWLKRSMDAGQSLSLPEMNQRVQQQHKAQLENVIMGRTLEVVPVADYDDAAVHIPEHDEEIAALQMSAEQGDEHSLAAVHVIEQHKQQHLAVEQQKAAQVGAAPGGPQQPAAPQQQQQLPPGAPPPPAG